MGVKIRPGCQQIAHQNPHFTRTAPGTKGRKAKGHNIIISLAALQGAWKERFPGVEPLEVRSKDQIAMVGFVDKQQVLSQAMRNQPLASLKTLAAEEDQTCLETAVISTFTQDVDAHYEHEFQKYPDHPPFFPRVAALATIEPQDPLGPEETPLVFKGVVVAASLRRYSGEGPSLPLQRRLNDFLLTSLYQQLNRDSGMPPLFRPLDQVWAGEWWLNYSSG